MSIEERFEKWISNHENIERVVLKVLPLTSLGFLVAGFSTNSKAWKYAFLSYATIFSGAFLYGKYVKFKEITKKYKFSRFIQYVARLYGTRKEA